MRKNHKKPNLFIVGSPKCGTTSLYHYLKEHPQICMSKEKELNYAEFSEYNPYIKNLKDYLSQWDHIKDEKIIWFILSGDLLHDPKGTIKGYLDANYKLEKAREFTGLKLYRYVK